MHRDGYYISWNKHKSIETCAEKRNSAVVMVTSSAALIPLEASSNNSLILPLIKNEKELTDSNACGDTLLLRSGTKYIVKVLEITDTQIKVRRCADKSGSVLTFNLTDVDKATDITGVVLTTPATKREVKLKNLGYDSLRNEPDYKLKNGIALSILLLILGICTLLAVALIASGGFILAIPFVVLLLIGILNFEGIKRNFIRGIIKSRVRMHINIRRSALFFLLTWLLFFAAAFLAGTVLLGPMLVLSFLSALVSFILSAKAFKLTKKERGKWLGILIFILALPTIIFGMLILALSFSGLV